MGHYAKVLDGKVIQVIVADADFFNYFVDNSPGNWIKTSYNARGNKHYNAETGLEDTSELNPPLRGNFAGVGYIYDQLNDVFYAPQPYPSWTLDKNSWLWMSPIPYPNDGLLYRWDEETLSWVLNTSSGV